eukprot:IDg9329t1
MKLGQYCGIPTYVCGEGLKCEGKGIKARCTRQVKNGDVCDSRYLRCEDGSKCLYWEGTSRCFAVPSKLVKCHQPGDKCPRGLKCNDGHCKEVLKAGQLCETKKAVCSKDLKCIGPAKRKQCRRQMQFGQMCGQPWWPCASGLECR